MGASVVRPVDHSSGAQSKSNPHLFLRRLIFIKYSIYCGLSITSFMMGQAADILFMVIGV